MNYIQEALRTNNPHAGGYGTVSPGLIHATLGIISESIELQAAIEKRDITNTIEELGDLMWFVALASDELGFDPFSEAIGAESPPPGEILSVLTDTVKRSYAYGKELDVQALRDTMRKLISFAEQLTVTLQQVGAPDFEAVKLGNINKLKARFPEKFTQDHALNRDPFSEMEAIDGVLK